MMEKGKKKICWITPDYFLIVDAPKVPLLVKEFDIRWILVNTYKTNRKTDGLLTYDFRPEEFNLRYRQRDLRIIFQYLKLIFRIRKEKADLIYISFHGFPFFFPIFLRFFHPAKIVWGVHNVRTPLGASNSRLMNIYQDYIFRRIRNIHVFSEYQLNVVKEIFPDKRHFLIPLTLEDYGKSQVSPPKDRIRFLFFGYIKEYKGLDLLIKSFQSLRKSGIDNIELHIVGKCENWGYYESMINGEAAIKTRIESIPNTDIPDVISSCHYILLPYRDSAQSGVLNLAFQYNRPVIISDIEAFRQSVTEGATGFYFKNGSVESLTSVMKEVIALHEERFPALTSNVKSFAEREFAMDEIVSRYRSLLNTCIGC
ncbi:MAG TPA: glycosyltransferase family 4 protein [Bacteroidales bacterium]|nr:glycosyltransferase family 4 protein [Bacteroidales bacterium]